MPTQVLKTISNGGGTIAGGGTADYASIALWVSADFGCASFDLTSVDQFAIGNCYTDGGEFTASGNVALIPSFIVTDATRTVTLQAAPGHGFFDNVNVLTNALAYNTSNGVAITNTGSAQTINSQIGNVFLKNLQIKSTVSAAVEFDSNAAGPGHIDNCILTNTLPESILNTGNNTSTGVIVNNCLLYSTGTGADAGHGRVSFFTAGNLVMNFCDVVTASDGNAVSAAFNGDASANVATVRNCAIYNSTAVTGTNLTATYTTCITDVASPPSGCTTIAYSSAGFRNTTIASGDYRQTIQRSGTPVSGITTDIAGQTRSASAPNIGAWEIAQASVTTQTTCFYNVF